MPKKLNKARLDAMVEEATVDGHDVSEQVSGLFTMIEENLKLPFETQVLGTPVTVERVDLNGRDEIVAVCRRGKYRQTIPILHLPLPMPAPPGAQWIGAYLHWAGGS